MVLHLGTPAALGASTDPAASTGYAVENWQAEQGLPRSTITAIAQTPDGYVWLGSPYGLVRFDGVRFVLFEEQVARDLGRGEVRDLHATPDGTLWIGTRRSGLLRYSRGVFESASLAYPQLHPAIETIATDADGTLWAVSGNGQALLVSGANRSVSNALVPENRGHMLFQLVRDMQGRFWFAKQDRYGRIEQGMPTNVVALPDGLALLAPARDGGLWLSTGSELRKLPAQGSETTPPVRLDFGLYGVAVLHEDRQGVLWVGTRRDGLHALVNGQLQRIPAVHHSVSAIAQDAEGNIWVGTEGEGLFRLRRRVFLTVGVPEGLPNDRVLSVDKGWVVPQEGGLVRLTPPGLAELVPGLERISLASVLADEEGGAWLGAVNGRLLRLDRDGQLTRFPFRFSVPDPQLRVLLQDRRKHLWMGGYPFGLFRLPAGVTSYFEDFTGRGLPQSAVTALAEDRDGRLWVGTADGKLHRLDGERFTSFGPEHGLPGTAIGALHVTEAGALWIGTLGGGVGRFRDGRARFAGVEHGLHDNVITQMVEDDAGFAWFGSSRGIFRVRLAELEKFADGGQSAVEAIPYGRSDGLVNVECSGGYQPSACKTKSGRLRFGTSKGVILVDPASLSFNDRPPPLVLEQVAVDGVALANMAHVELSHDYRKLEFRYTALSFCAPERVRFRRQVVGFDSDWVEDRDARSASYPQLPPGQYTFRFTACNNDGIWNETPVAFAFTVKPALWQMWWFRLGALALFALAVALAARYAATVRMRRRLQRLEQAHAVERERARIARDLHDDLGARLTRMSYQTDLAAAELGERSPQAEDLRSVADQARQATRALDEAVWLIHPGKESLRHLVEYIGQYANEFFRHSSIHCRRDLPRELPEWPLPAEWRHHLFLAVKEALNNAHKHSGATEIWIRVRFEPPDLQIQIEENGRGFATATANGAGNGLANLRQRLAGLSGAAVVTSEAGRGTLVRLSVRLPAPAGGGLNPR